MTRPLTAAPAADAPALEALDDLVKRPQAIATVKRSLRQLHPYHDHAVQAAATFASSLASEEGREGTSAFRSGREPAWASAAPDWGDGGGVAAGEAAPATLTGQED